MSGGDGRGKQAAERDLLCSVPLAVYFRLVLRQELVAVRGRLLDVAHLSLQSGFLLLSQCCAQYSQHLETSERGTGCRMSPSLESLFYVSVGGLTEAMAREGRLLFL